MRFTPNSRILARARRARRRRDCFLSLISWALLLLGFFMTYFFISVPNAFAFVRLWLAQCADLRHHLTEPPLVSALKYDFGLARRFGLYPLLHNLVYRLRKTQRQLYSFTLDPYTITDTNQLQLFLKALANTCHHAID